MTVSESSIIPLCEGADPNPRAARFTPPAGACDCHAHVFEPVARYPYVANRTYTPPDASFDSYRYMLATLGLERGVIVQPSVYGTDNRATLDAVAEGGENFRAVVVVNEDISSDELAAYHRAGARGIRVNLLFKSEVEISSLHNLAAKIADFGWHLQVLIDVSSFDDVRGALGNLPVDVVFDHMGHMPTGLGLDHPGFRDLLALLEAGKAWVKLSGSYRFTAEQQPPYRDVEPFARELIRANPERALWASDWPHPCIPVAVPNCGSLLDMLLDWAPDETTRKRILVDNPATLYGFE